MDADGFVAPLSVEYFNAHSPDRLLVAASTRRNKPTTRMAAAAAAPPPTVVVDARYCVAEATAFAVARVVGATDRDFAVTDAAGAVAMRVEAAVFTFRKRTVLADAAGRPVVTMLESAHQTSSMWEVFRGESSSRRDLLFSVVKESVVQVRTKVFVYLSGYCSVDQVPDFVVRGSYHDGECTVFAVNSGDDAIAQITQILAGTVRGFTRHVYTTRINPGIDQAFILSIAVILHEMHH